MGVFMILMSGSCVHKRMQPIAMTEALQLHIYAVADSMGRKATEAQIGDDPNNTRWAKDKTRFGYRMLLKYGWIEGNGLGRKQEGNASHVSVEKRDEGLGIGAERLRRDDSRTMRNTSSFEDILQSLSKYAPKPIDVSSEGSDSDSSCSESESTDTKGASGHRASRHRSAYKKILTSKSVRHYSDGHKAEILGRCDSSNSLAKQTESDSSSEAPETSEKDLASRFVSERWGLQTMSEPKFNFAAITIDEYFSKRLLKVQNGNTSESNGHMNGASQESDDGSDANAESKKKERKSKKKRKREGSDSEEGDSNESSGKKKSKKSSKREKKSAADKDSKKKKRSSKSSSKKDKSSSSKKDKSSSKKSKKKAKSSS